MDMRKEICMKQKSSMIPMIIVTAMVVLLLLPALKTIFSSKDDSSGAVIAADTEYFLTWEEYVAGHGISDWNWNDAADAIEKVAIHAADLYEGGDNATAYE